jgi:RNase P subunit RPR2
MLEQMNCDLCETVTQITSTARHAIDKDGLILLCKECWMEKGLTRTRYYGQIQNGYYLAAN